MHSAFRHVAFRLRQAASLGLKSLASLLRLPIVRRRVPIASCPPPDGLVLWRAGCIGKIFCRLGNMANTILIGAQWGDEGKGKIIDVLTARADIVVRSQGGNNAGHTVTHRGTK